MATDEGNDTQSAAGDRAETAQSMRPSKAVTATSRFVEQHGGSARAVVENLGQAGARIVLIGQDGALGDVIVRDVATGESVVAQVAEVTLSEWDTATTSALTIGAEHRRRMARTRR